jgi:hypothetical protein
VAGEFLKVGGSLGQDGVGPSVDYPQVITDQEVAEGFPAEVA